MKGSQINSEYYKICSICNKSNLDLNIDYIKNKKFKENLKFIQPKEFVKKCFCKSLKKDINNEYNIYAHKYCILYKIIFNFEIKCEKCNTVYNIKINKRVDIKKIIYLCIIFVIVYLLHLTLYILSVFLLLIDKILKNNIIKKKYIHLPWFFTIILIIINSIILYFSISNNLHQYKNILVYIININNIENMNIKNSFYESLYEFYNYFHGKTILLNNRHKIFIINKGNIDNNKEIKIFIKENNKLIKREKIPYISLKEKSKVTKEEKNIIDNCITIKNNIPCQIKENENPLDIIEPDMLLNKKEDKIEINNENKENLLDDLYSEKTGKEEENDHLNNNLNTPKNLIDMTGIKKINKDYINININPIQANNINININFNKEINDNNNSPYKENNEFLFNPNKLLLHQSNGKTALIPNKNYINKIIDDNTYKNYLKKRKQLKSIKLKQKNIQMKNIKISGNIEENEEIDFSEFENEKMDYSMTPKNNKFVNIKNTGVYNNNSIGNDLFKTKKSFKDVPLNLSNPTENEGNDEMLNNRLSLKNNLKYKNANFSYSNK